MLLRANVSQSSGSWSALKPKRPVRLQSEGGACACSAVPNALAFRKRRHARAARRMYALYVSVNAQACKGLSQTFICQGPGTCMTGSMYTSLHELYATKNCTSTRCLTPSNIRTLHTTTRSLHTRWEEGMRGTQLATSPPMTRKHHPLACLTLGAQRAAINGRSRSGCHCGCCCPLQAARPAPAQACHQPLAMSIISKLP